MLTEKLKEKKSVLLILVLLVVVLAVVALGSANLKKKNTSQNSNTQTSTQTKEETAAPKIDVMQEGYGDKVVKAGDSIVVNYVGTLEDGTTFDSSIARGTPFETRIGVGDVIKGWDEGLIGMKVGEKRKLTIPPELGYGDTSVGNIPANSTLIFDIELLEIK